MNYSVVHNGAIVHSGKREVMRQVIECCCDKEARDGVSSVPLEQATERAARYCSVHQDCTLYSVFAKKGKQQLMKS